MLLLRHGETEWNRAGRFQGLRDSALTETGRVQAVAMGGVLRGLSVSAATHDAITSPQGRARETARIVLDGTGLEAREDARLVEIAMGDWTGLGRSEIQARWPGPENEAMFDFYARCPGGERLENVARRARAVIAALQGPTVIVTHGITLRMLCALALGQPWESGGRLHLRQGAVIRIAGGRMDAIEPPGLPEATAPGNPRPPGG